MRSAVPRSRIGRAPWTERVLAVELHFQLARHQRLRLRRLEAEGTLAEARGDGGAEQHGPLDRPLRWRNGLQQAIDHHREQRPRRRQRRGVDRAEPRRGPLVEERLEHRVDERAARPRRQPRLLDDVFLEAEHVAREVLERARAVAIERGHRVGDRPDAARRPPDPPAWPPAPSGPGRPACVATSIGSERDGQRERRRGARRVACLDGGGRQRHGVEVLEIGRRADDRVVLERERRERERAPRQVQQVVERRPGGGAAVGVVRPAEILEQVRRQEHVAARRRRPLPFDQARQRHVGVAAERRGRGVDDVDEAGADARAERLRLHQPPQQRRQLVDRDGRIAEAEVGLARALQQAADRAARAQVALPRRTRDRRPLGGGEDRGERLELRGRRARLGQRRQRLGRPQQRGRRRRAPDAGAAGRGRARSPRASAPRDRSAARGRRRTARRPARDRPRPRRRPSAASTSSRPSPSSLASPSASGSASPLERRTAAAASRAARRRPRATRPRRRRSARRRPPPPTVRRPGAAHRPPATTRRRRRGPGAPGRDTAAAAGGRARSRRRPAPAAPPRGPAARRPRLRLRGRG